MTQQTKRRLVKILPITAEVGTPEADVTVECIEREVHVDEVPGAVKTIVAYYVDVGDRPPSEALTLVNQVREAFKKGALAEDKSVHPVFIPAREGRPQSRVEVYDIE